MTNREDNIPYVSWDGYMTPEQMQEYKAMIKRKSKPVYPRWIPCSVRLPEYRKVVLISTYWGVRVGERDSVKEDGTDDFWYMFLNDATARPMYVYAWMPLPKPYKEIENE